MQRENSEVLALEAEVSDLNAKIEALRPRPETRTKQVDQQQTQPLVNSEFVMPKTHSASAVAEAQYTEPASDAGVEAVHQIRNSNAAQKSAVAERTRAVPPPPAAEKTAAISNHQDNSPSASSVVSRAENSTGGHTSQQADIPSSSVGGSEPVAASAATVNAGGTQITHDAVGEQSSEVDSSSHDTPSAPQQREQRTQATTALAVIDSVRLSDDDDATEAMYREMFADDPAAKEALLRLSAHSRRLRQLNEVLESRVHDTPFGKERPDDAPDSIGAARRLPPWKMHAQSHDPPGVGPHDSAPSHSDKSSGGELSQSVVAPDQLQEDPRRASDSRPPQSFGSHSTPPWRRAHVSAVDTPSPQLQAQRPQHQLPPWSRSAQARNPHNMMPTPQPQPSHGGLVSMTAFRSPPIPFEQTLDNALRSAVDEMNRTLDEFD